MELIQKTIRYHQEGKRKPLTSFIWMKITMCRMPNRMYAGSSRGWVR